MSYSRIDDSLPQDGNCSCQTRLWHLMTCPFFAASAVVASPSVNVNVPGLGSMASHFCAFPGVSCPKSEILERAAVYTASSVGLSVAVPKYSNPYREYKFYSSR